MALGGGCQMWDNRRVSCTLSLGKQSLGWLGWIWFLPSLKSHVSILILWFGASGVTMGMFTLLLRERFATALSLHQHAERSGEGFAPA